MIFKRKLIFETCANCGKKIEDDEEALLIDDDNDQIFCSENCLRENFDETITMLEGQHFEWRETTDIPVTDFQKFHHLLELVINEPDEIWDVDRSDEEAPISFYIGEFIHEKEPIYYIAAAYLIEDKPVFVYTHFPTKSQELVQKYRQGTLIFSGIEDEEISSADNAVLERLLADDDDEDDLDTDLDATTEDPEGQEGGSMTDEEENEIIAPIAKLVEEASNLRHEDDIQADDFENYELLRVKTLETPDEIWKVVTEEAITILVHITFNHMDGEFVAYIVLSIEGDLGESFPVYGFPTLDHRVVDVFRRGSNIFRRQIQTV